MSSAIRHEIVKRAIDSSRLEVRVCHGIVYLSGEVRELRGGAEDLRKEMDILHQVIRGKPGIREVINEAFLRSRAV
ncbi:MAG TPA: BON domain-containing protein [Armatimonadota bacterium]